MQELNMNYIITCLIFVVKQTIMSYIWGTVNLSGLPSVFQRQQLMKAPCAINSY